MNLFHSLPDWSIMTNHAGAKRHCCVNVVTMRSIRSFLVLAGLMITLIGCGASSDQEMEIPLAIWSSSTSTSDTPEGAARSAVQSLIGVTPVLGDYMAGDNRSGEMLVFSPGETTPVERSLLLLRQLGSDDQWSVIGAINAAMTIDRPEARSVVPADVLTVSGRGRGFEGLVVVSAHRIGDDIELIDQKIAMGGSLERSEPFVVELDLSEADPGDVIAIVVRGGVGLEDDPGEFSAIPIRIGP